ncbi:glycosyltransferase family 61 protein [Pseudotabrizicola sp. 4114]|uniref:glycosyltransferase family 61 protein n=1 Tax=Pseudotabrizicola sp. 4114 TaxID=2817731 RepID=UPI00285F75DB|nr:capsular polysaccharide biosynthesis protein [Pseudorhodobacter sp. 4114]
MRSETLKINFDPCTPWGSKEHYFHFLHGYLLPGLHLAISGGYQNIQFEDCGPVMQPKILEACKLLSLTYIPPMMPTQGDMVKAPRWDRILLHFDAPPPSEAVISAFRETSALVVHRLFTASERALRQAGIRPPAERNGVIIFQRSADHPFYHSDQMSKSARYGKGRRSLLNAEDLTAAIRKIGFNAHLIDFGVISLAEQIVASYHADAIIGIRGAEFANTIWMRPNTQAIMFGPPCVENNATRILAKSAKVLFSFIKVAKAHVVLQKDEMERVNYILKNKVDT